MANALSYIANIGKSVKYSSIDAFKEMNPVVKSFYETNNDIIKDTYIAMKDIKNTAKNSYTKAMESPVAGLAKNYYNNLIDDIKTGKFYNRERIQRDEMQAAKTFIGEDSDFGFDFNDDFNFGEGDDDNFGFNDSSSDMSSGLGFDDVDMVAEKSVNAINQVTARSAQYQVEAQRQSTKILYDQNVAIFGEMHSHMGAMNSNLSIIFDYLKENGTAHFENSKTYFESSTALMKEQNGILKEILELQKSYYGSKKESTIINNRDRIRYSDIVDSDGVIDIENYMKLIKQNIADANDGTMDLVKTMLDSGALNTIGSSPLKALTDTFVKTLVPKLMKDSLKELNQTLSGLTGSILMKITDMNGDINPIISKIGEVLGLESTLKRNVDTSNYEKGSVPFDGVTRKAIIEVIPTYLSKIYSAVSGKDETRYDYNRGRFTSLEKIQQEYNNMMDQSSISASGNIRRAFMDYKKAINFKGNEKQEEEFDKDMEAFFKYHFKNAKLYSKKRGVRDYGMNGQYSEENLKLLQQMWERLPRSLRMQYAGNIYEARDSYNRRIQSIEENAMDPLMNLFNGSIEEEEIAQANKPIRKAEQVINNTKENKQSDTIDNKIWLPNSARKTNAKRNTKAIAKIDETKLNKAEEDRLRFNEDNPGFLEDLIYETESYKKYKKATGKASNIFADAVGAVNDYIYTFVFGDDKYDEDKEDNGFLRAVLNKTEETFERFNTWLDHNILFPLKNKINRQSIHDAASNFFNMFGLDLDYMIDSAKTILFGDKKEDNGLIGGFFKDVKEQFKGVKKYVKESFLDVIDFFGVRGKKNKKGEEKTANNRQQTENTNIFKRKLNELFNQGATADDLNKMADDIEKGMNPFDGLQNLGKKKPENKKVPGEGEIDNAAKGIKRVNKTGVVAVSEGELIIPPDMNPFNINERYRKENKQKDKFASYLKLTDEIQNYANGGTVSPEDVVNQKEREDALNRAKKAATKQYYDKKQKMNREDYDELPLYMKMQDELNNLINVIREFANGMFGSVKDKVGGVKDGLDDKFGGAISDVMSNLKDYAPGMFTGGLLGGGVSLVTGAIGGPILGASAGIAISLIKDSKQVRRFLFGDKVDGEFEGGLLSKNISNNLNKYFPDMAKGATVGAITSILPFVPGGPVAGIILGSSIGFAKNNEAIKEKLFGEDGILGKDFPDRVKKALPRMGLGAIAGLVGGPFGVATNVILGSAFGFATTTDKFKDIVFGTENENGEREGGLLGAIKENIIDPTKDLFGSILRDTRDWFQTEIKDNLNKFIDPFTNRMEMFGKNIFGFLSRSIEKMFEKAVATPVGRMVNNVTERIGKFATKTIDVTTGLAKGIVATPFRVLGKVGDKMRTTDIKKGNAKYMSAAERVAFRKEKGFGAKWFGMKDQFTETDELIAGMNEDQLRNIKESMDYAQDAKKNAKKSKIKALKNLKELEKYRVINTDQLKTINAYVQENNLEGAYRIIDNLPNTYTNKNGEIVTTDKAYIKEIIKKNAEKYQKAKAIENNNEDISGKLFSRLRKAGFKDINAKNLNKYRDYIERELKVRGGDAKEKYQEGAARTFEEQVREEQKLRHEEIVNLFVQANELLKKVIDPDYKPESKDIKDFSNKVDNKKDKKEKDQKEKTNNLLDEEIEDDTLKSRIFKVFGKTKQRIKKTVIGEKDEELKDEEIGFNLKTFRNINKEIKDKIFNRNNAEDDTEGNSPDKKKNTRFEFYNGRIMKFIKDKSGSWTHDKADSETNAALLEKEQEKQNQKTLVDTITSLPGKIFEFFAGRNKATEEDKKDGLFSKIIKKALKVVGIATLIGFLPKLGEFYTNKVKPILGTFFDGVKNGFIGVATGVVSLPYKIGTTIGGLFSKAKSWIMGEGDYEGKGFPSLVKDKIIPFYLEGFEYLCANVVPKMVEILISSLPNIIKGAIKGVFNMTDGIISGFVKALRPDTNAKASYTIDKSTSSDVFPIPVEAPSNYKVSSAWKLGNNITLNEDTNSYNPNTTSNTEPVRDENGNITYSALSKTEAKNGTRKKTKNHKLIQKNLPKAFNNVASNQQEHAMESYNNVKDQVVDLGDYGQMTVEELMNRDDIVLAQATDANGNTFNITGADMLKYPEVASQFGIDSQLTQAERVKASKEILGDDYGSGGRNTLGKTIKAGVKSFLIGGYDDKVVKRFKNFGKGATGKVLKKIPIVGKVTSAVDMTTSIMGNVLEKSGKFGRKILPKWMFGSAAKEKARQEATKATNKKDIFAKTVNKAKDIFTEAAEKNKTVGKVKDVIVNKKDEITKTLKKAKDIATDTKAGSLFSKFLSTVKEAIEKFFSESKLGKLIKKYAGKEMSEEAASKMIKTLGTELADAVEKKFSKTAGKLIAKSSARMASYVASGGLIAVAFAVTAFINGFRKGNAGNLFGVTDPTLLQRLVSAISYAVNEAICAGLLPLDWIFETVYGILKSFGFGFEKLDKQREESANKVAEYNLEHGTDFDVEDYNNSQKWTTKAKNAFKSFFGGNKKKKKNKDTNKKKSKKDKNNITNYDNEQLTDTETKILEGTQIKAAGYGANMDNVYIGNSNPSTETEQEGFTNTINTKTNVFDNIKNLIGNKTNTEDTASYINESDLMSYSINTGVENANDTITQIISDLDLSLKVIQTEHENTINKFNKSSFDNFWDVKSLDKLDGFGKTLANFITYYEKALLLPMMLVNDMVANATTTIVPDDVAIETSGDTSSTSSTTSTSSIKKTKKTTKKKKKKSVLSKVKKGITSVAKKIKSVFTGSGSGIDSNEDKTSNILQFSNPQSEDNTQAKSLLSFTTPNDMRTLRQKGYFVSQTDSTVANMPFTVQGDTENQTIKDAGCAPAAATMAINLANRAGITNKTQTFSNAVKDALEYKLPDDGVTADYFIDEFSRNNMSTAFISGSDSNMKQSIMRMLKTEKPVVLIGADENNTNKRFSPFGPTGHYVVATGMSEDGQNIYINDPESKTPNKIYRTEDVLKAVTLGIAPVVKNAQLDSKTRNSKVSQYMKNYRGQAISGNSNRQKVWNYLKSKGYSEAAAAGVIGNLMWESGGTSDIKLNAVESNGEGIGMCQWSYGRKRNFLNFLKSKGASWPTQDIQLQLDFMLSELEGNQWIWTNIGSEYGADAKVTIAQFKQCNDIAKATTYFCANFERCHKKDAHLDTRIKYAQAAYNEFTGSGGGVTSVNFKKYNLTEAQYKGIANIAIHEQGDSEAGIKAETSLIANRADLHNGGDIVKTVTGGWFANGKSRFNNPGNVSSTAVNYVKQVLAEGKRTLPNYVDEHDYIGDIASVTNDGATIDKNDKSKYIQFKSIINQGSSVGGGKWTYYSHPSDSSDPFGYTSEANRSKYGEGYYDLSGNPIGSGGDSSSSSSEPAWKNPKTILDLFTIFDDLAKGYGMSTDTTTESTDGTSSTTSATGATVSDAQKAELQRKLANSFIKSENAIQKYSQGNRYNFTVADDGTISGSSIDCSAAVQKVYEKILGVDPGSWTGAQATDSDTYTVEQGSGSPGSAPTLDKLQLGDLLIYGPSGSKHVEMFTGVTDKGQTMGAGSAPAPHWNKGTVVNGKISDYHTQKNGLYVVRRWNGFKGAGSDLDLKSVVGAGSGLLNRAKQTISKDVNKPNGGRSIIQRFIGRGTHNINSNADRYITEAYDRTKAASSNPTSFNITESSIDTKPFNVQTTKTTNNITAKTTSNSAELVSMLKGIVKILVKLVDNSDNLKEIVTLLTKLVTTVSTKNTGLSKEEKTSTAASLKTSLINSINTATKSNPDKELLDIINSMETLASD